MNRLLYMLALLCGCMIFAQSKPFKISGTVLSEHDQSPLESATIYLETLKDSTLVTYTLSDKNGAFVLDNRTYEDSLNLTISYIGLESYSKIIRIGKIPMQLNTITLKTANVLDEVFIKSRAPISIKKDTLEFNVASFKTKKDANVEDLLKELPGLEVDEEGKIKVNGKKVSEILVNGKSFFGDDLTIATRNLTKDIIDKIQITDTKTKSQAFTGEKGDSDSKSINLTIKEENNKGAFGRIAVGAGTDHRYQIAGMANIFDNERRLSVLTGGNNINSTRFNLGDTRKMHFGEYNSGGEGITKTHSVGVNYVDELSENNYLSTDYNHSSSHSDNATTIERENILPDSRYFTNSSSRSSNDTDSNRGNLHFEVKVDSTFLINAGSSFLSSKTMATYERQEASRDANNVLTNQSLTTSFVENTGKDFSNNLVMTKRFGGGGSFLRVHLTSNIRANSADDFLNSETNIYGADPSDLVRDQLKKDENNSQTLSFGITYRLPLDAKKWFVDFNYGFDNRKHRDIKSTFDFDEDVKSYINFNKPLSSHFINRNKRHNPNLSLVHDSEKMHFMFGTGYSNRTIENTDKFGPELSLKRTFGFLELNAYIDYIFSPKASLNFHYDYQSQAPEISQLQPYQNVSDPLNTITGNTELRPSATHNINLGYNSFDFQKSSGLYAYATVNLLEDKVVLKTLIDDDFVRNTTYTNVSGEYSVNIDSKFIKSYKLDSLQSIKVDVGLEGRINKQINFSNTIEYATLNTSIAPSVRATYKWKNLFTMRPGYRLKLARSHYDLQNFHTRNVVSHDLSVRSATFFPKKLEWSNVISFRYNPNVAQGFHKSAWFWNASLAYSILKDKGTVSFIAYDLLNQNTNANRISTDNYIQDSQSSVLEQYFMLSFSWKFNSLGSKSERRNEYLY